MAARKGTNSTALEPRAGDVQAGQRLVRVGRRVAVTGKVFDGGGDALLLQPLDKGDHVGRDVRGVVAKGALADHRVLGIVIHVGDGREVDVHAQAA